MEQQEPLARRRLGTRRFIVPGAAGFIGSHLAEASSGGPRGGRDRLFTDYYDPALKEENAAASTSGASTSPPTSSTSPASTDLPPRRPAGRAQLRRRLRAVPRRNLLASQRVFEAAAAAGVRVVFASSSSIYGEAKSYPTPEDWRRGRSPYGITKLACEHVARATPQLRAGRRRAPLLQRLRPAAAARHGVPAHRRRARHRLALRALRRRPAEPRLHLRRRTSSRRPCSRWSALRSARSTTSAAARR